VKTPVIASGGMADGRSLAAALTLGADGVNMGTRFLASRECAIHENVKRKIVENTERDTCVINRTLRNSSRVAKNAVSTEVLQIQQDASLGIEAVRHLVAGVRGRTRVLQGGDVEDGIWTAGQSQGLIHDIPSCQDLISNIMRQAEDVLTRCARAVSHARHGG
jgi:nitronate monooxygenase